MRAASNIVHKENESSWTSSFYYVCTLDRLTREDRRGKKCNSRGRLHFHFLRFNKTNILDPIDSHPNWSKAICYDFVQFPFKLSSFLKDLSRGKCVKWKWKQISWHLCGISLKELGAGNSVVWVKMAFSGPSENGGKSLIKISSKDLCSGKAF